MTATLDQVYAALTLANRKLDTLLQEAGILMSQSDDIAAATQVITDEVATLNTSADQITALVQQLKDAGQVDPAVLAQFDSALATLKPSVDKIASIAAPPTPGA